MSTGISDIGAALEAMASVLGDFLPEFRAVIEQTRISLVLLSPPPDVQDAHSELLAAYDDVLRLVDDAIAQLDQGVPADDVFATVFAGQRADEIGQRFSRIAEEFTTIADAAGFDGFVGGGILVANSAGSDTPGAVNVDSSGDTRGDTGGTPRYIGLTGIPEVDVGVETVLGSQGNAASLETLLEYVTTECTLELGDDGPPKCWQVPGAAQVEGTLVEIFPTSVCAAEYQPRAEEIDRMLDRLASVVGVHAVYQIDNATSTEPYWPVGDYAIVFFSQGGDQTYGTRIRLADAKIVRIDFRCGPTPAERFAVPGATNLPCLRSNPCRSKSGHWKMST